VGAALSAAGHLPPAAGAGLTASAKLAFVHGSNVANVAAGIIALVGVAVALRFLPKVPRRRPVDRTVHQQVTEAV
jgi:hypothetical protein